MTAWLKQLLNNAENQKGVKAKWLDGSCPIFIHGTGSMASDILHVLAGHGLQVFGFIDHMDQASSPVDGVPV